MTNEIKEILDYLEDKDNYIEELGIAYKRIFITNGDLKTLLDYITNLQDEILGLETKRDVLKSEVKALKADKKYYQERYECLFNRKLDVLDFCYRYLQLDLEEFDVYELFKKIIKILKGEE